MLIAELFALWPERPRRPAGLGLALGIALALASGLPAARAVVTLNTSNFLVDCWQTEDGLPQSSVKSIVQTPDGYLWLATFGGLARFDGLRFTVFDTGNIPRLPSSRLIRLHVDRQGGLWLVTEHHELARLAQGQCQRYGAAEGLPPEGAEWVDEDLHGQLWMADPVGGLFRWQDSRFVRVLSNLGFGTGPVRMMESEDRGRVLFRQGDRVACFQGGQFTVLRGPDGAAEAVVKGVCGSGDGSLWMVTPEGLRKWRSGQWLAQLWPGVDFQSHLEGLLEDPAGDLWLATYSDGLFRLGRDATWEHFTVDASFPTRSVRCLFRDREGNLWAGTDGSGLLRIKPRLWKMVTRREGLGIDAVHSVSQDAQGRIWFAGGTKLPYWLDRGVVAVAIGSPLSDPMDGVFSVLAARDGAMWIGIYRGKVFRYKDGALTAYSAQEGMRAGSVRALLEDRQGAVWVGGFGGLSRIQGGQVTHYSRREGLSSEQVWALAEDRAGTLYVGTQRGGLNLWRGGRFTVLTREQGLPDDSINALYLDADDVLWIGTPGSGLARFKEGRFTSYGTRAGMLARQVGPMLEDDTAHLWMVSDLGILRVSRQELNEVAAGKRVSVNCVTHTRGDGLATRECSGIQPACCRARDGRLWFGTAKGAAYMDPKQLRLNPLPPPVVLEAVLMDDQRARGRVPGNRGPLAAPAEPSGGEHASRFTLAALELTPPTGLVVVPPRTHRLDFHFTALTFTAPERTRFRCRLEGYDAEWLDLGNERVAHYTRVPPGRYQFRVTACNNDGVWNETGAALAVSVQPAWWQTWWLRALALLAGAAAVLGFYEGRILQLKRRRILQEDFARQLIASQEKERHRIATELHDSLGQNLLVIKNRAYLGMTAGENAPAMQAQLEEISEASAQAIEEVRAIARALRPYQLERLGLPLALKALTDQLAASTSLRVEADLAALEGRPSSEAAISLYRIVQESLNNVAKHARASTVRVQARATAAGLCLTIQDDGRGFDVAAVRNQTQPQAAFGLLGLAERVRLLGGTLTVDSHPGRGTRLEIVIPSPRPTP